MNIMFEKMIISPCK